MSLPSMVHTDTRQHAFQDRIPQKQFRRREPIATVLQAAWHQRRYHEPHKKKYGRDSKRG